MKRSINFEGVKTKVRCFVDTKYIGTRNIVRVDVTISGRRGILLSFYLFGQ